MPTTNRNLAHEALADLRLLISCQNANFPSDAEWDNWLSTARNLHHQVGAFRLLVVTPGGHPTKAQLERLRATNRDTNPTTAIISSSRAYRFMASALTFINPSLRCFSTIETEKAFDYLALTQGERERVSEVIERLNRQLSS